MQEHLDKELKCNVYITTFNIPHSDQEKIM